MCDVWVFCEIVFVDLCRDCGCVEIWVVKFVVVGEVVDVVGGVYWMWCLVLKDEECFYVDMVGKFG